MPASRLPGIFISYRRSDNPDATGRIYDRLVAEFGKARVFKDVDSIPLGQDFRGHLNDIVGNCAAVLAIIGPKWTDARNSAGARRLEDPDDFVRIELEAALARDVPVVPVLVAHAPMPGTADLPASLASMAFRQSIEVRPDPDFHNDATRLVAALQRILDPNAPIVKPQSGQQRTWITALAAAVALGGIALALFAWKYPRVTPSSEIRTEISTPRADRPQDIALSPDGLQIAFAAKDGDVTRLWVRSLDSEVARPLPGTDGAMDPFWSPDSGSIAFFTPEALKRFDLAGGLVRVMLTRKFPGTGGGSWSEQGVILFATGPGPIMQIPAAGGEAVPVTKVGADPALHVGPYFVENGRRFLYTEIRYTAINQEAAIYLGSMDGDVPVRLVEAANRSAWLRPGWLVWEQNGSLLAQRLDLDKASLTGDPVAITDRTAGFAGNSATVANTELIAFRRTSQGLRQLRWVDRSGAVLEAIGEPDGSYQLPRVSPDGRRISVTRVVNGSQNVWLFNGPRLSRLTFGAALDGQSLWFPDGRNIAFFSISKKEGLQIFRKSADGVGMESQLTHEDTANFPVSFSPDGHYLLYNGTRDLYTERDLYLQPLDGGRASTWLKTPFNEHDGSFSPDGRWIAYASNPSGPEEVFVRPFHPPEPKGGPPEGAESLWQVSVAGGSSPMWRRDGKEIFFVSPKGEMMAAPVSATGSAFSTGTPVRLFTSRIVLGPYREYDVAPDGRFLINTELDAGVPTPIVLIQNWNPEAKKAQH